MMLLVYFGFVLFSQGEERIAHLPHTVSGSWHSKCSKSAFSLKTLSASQKIKEIDVTNGGPRSGLRKA